MDFFHENLADFFPRGVYYYLAHGYTYIMYQYPIAQPGFPVRGQFRHGVDIVSAPTIDPILDSYLEIDPLTQQYNVMHSKRDIKVSISVAFSKILRSHF